MKYINKVTGAVIDARCEISGGDWEPMPEGKGSPDSRKPEAKKPGRKPKESKE